MQVFILAVLRDLVHIDALPKGVYARLSVTFAMLLIAYAAVVRHSKNPEQKADAGQGTDNMNP